MRCPSDAVVVFLCALVWQGGRAEAQHGRMGQAGGSVHRPPQGLGGLGGQHHQPSLPQVTPGHAHGGSGSGFTVLRNSPSSGDFSGRGHHHHHHGGHGHFYGFSGGYGWAPPPDFGYYGGGYYSGGYGGYGYSPGLPMYGGYYYGPEGLYPLPGYDDYGPPLYGYGPVPTRPAAPPGAFWGDPPVRNPAVGIEPLDDNRPRRIEESTPAAQLKSVRDQGRGDLWFREQKYQLARERYKTAVESAGDRAEARFRLALAHAALGSYAEAVRELKIGLQLDPIWPSRAEPLDVLFGPENQLAKMSLISRVSTWAREDVRDPDRLFLTGVLLYLNGTVEKAMPFFEAASRLGGEAPHLQAFLSPRDRGTAEPVESPQQDPPAREPQVPQENPEDVFLPPLPADAEPPTAPQRQQPSAPKPQEPVEKPAQPEASGPVLPPLPNP